MELLAGSTVPLAADPGSGNWSTLTATYISAANHPLAWQALTILLDGDAALNNYDNVRLSTDLPAAAPEPSTWALFSLGTAAFVGKRRRRKT